MPAGATSESVMTAVAPAATACAINRLPSLESPFMATKASPGFTLRESYSTPVTCGFPLLARISTPFRRSWKCIDCDCIARFLFDQNCLCSLDGANQRPKRTVILAPAATCAPGAGDCSCAMPLPTISRSNPLASAVSIAERTDFPKNDGTAIPPCSTSRTTVPLLCGVDPLATDGADGFDGARSGALTCSRKAAGVMA